MHLCRGTRHQAPGVRPGAAPSHRAHNCRELGQWVASSSQQPAASMQIVKSWARCPSLQIIARPRISSSIATLSPSSLPPKQQFLQEHNFCPPFWFIFVLILWDFFVFNAKIYLSPRIARGRHYIYGARPPAVVTGTSRITGKYHELMRTVPAQPPIKIDKCKPY